MRAHRLLLLILLAPVLGLAQSTGGPYVMKKDVIAAGGQQASAPAACWLALWAKAQRLRPPAAFTR